jgi:hypothetical protein
MLNKYFDQIYVINLDSRPDRLKATLAEFNKIGSTFVKVQAVDGYKAGLQVKPYKPMDENFWNPGAAGLLLSTARVIEDAKRKGYRRILICEDDVEFSPQFPAYLPYLKDVPRGWQMMLFGAQHMRNPISVTPQIGKVTDAFCLHCYAVNCDIFDYYLSLVKKMDKQLDLITIEDLQPIGRTYCFTPNMAFQKKGFSDIQKQNVNHSFLMTNKFVW